MRVHKSLKDYTLRTYNKNSIFNDSCKDKALKVGLGSLLLLLSGCCCW
jgi:hypothetical protein